MNKIICLVLLFAAVTGVAWTAAQDAQTVLRLDPAIDRIVPQLARLEKLRDGYEAKNAPAH